MNTVLRCYLFHLFNHSLLLFFYPSIHPSINPSIHPMHDMMAAAQNELFNENDLSLKISIVCNRNKTQIKWFRNLEELKGFLAKELKIEGVWSFVPGNGGFHVLRTTLVSISFYPGTKTLSIQGTKHKQIIKQIISYAKNDVKDIQKAHKTGSINEQETTTETVYRTKW